MRHEYQDRGDTPPWNIEIDVFAFSLGGLVAYEG